MKLSDILKDNVLAVTNVEDFLWEARTQGVTELEVTLGEMKVICICMINWLGDHPQKNTVIREGIVDRFFGVNLTLV